MLNLTLLLCSLVIDCGEFVVFGIYGSMCFSIGVLHSFYMILVLGLADMVCWWVWYVLLLLLPMLLPEGWNVKVFYIIFIYLVHGLMLLPSLTDETDAY